MVEPRADFRRLELFTAPGPRADRDPPRASHGWIFITQYAVYQSDLVAQSWDPFRFLQNKVEINYSQNIETYPSNFINVKTLLRGKVVKKS